MIAHSAYVGDVLFNERIVESVLGSFDSMVVCVNDCICVFFHVY